MNISPTLAPVYMYTGSSAHARFCSVGGMNGPWLKPRRKEDDSLSHKPQPRLWILDVGHHSPPGLRHSWEAVDSHLPRLFPQTPHFLRSKNDPPRARARVQQSVLREGRKPGQAVIWSAQLECLVADDLRPSVFRIRGRAPHLVTYKRNDDVWVRLTLQLLHPCLCLF